jgi:hypothetical protein
MWITLWLNRQQTDSSLRETYPPPPVLESLRIREKLAQNRSIRGQAGFCTISP